MTDSSRSGAGAFDGDEAEGAPGELGVEGPDPAGRLRASGYARALAGFVLFLGVLGAVIGVGLVINQLTQPGGSVTVTVTDPSIVDVERPDDLPDGASLDLSEALDRVQLQVADLPGSLRALTEAPMLLVGLLGLVGAVLLRRILLEIGAGRPFAPAVPGRLAGLAVVVVAGAILPSAVDGLVTVAVLEHLDHEGLGSPIGFTILSLNLLPLLGAGLLGIASRVFAHGQRLTEELEGLV